MTKDDIIRMALEALDMMVTPRSFQAQVRIKEIYDIIREALAQPEQNQFNPDWDAMAVMVEEQQRMAKRIAELEAQRKPLTDEEIGRVAGDSLDAWSCARAIEQAHGIKE